MARLFLLMICAATLSSNGSAVAQTGSLPVEKPVMSEAEMAQASAGQEVITVEALTRQQLTGATTGNTINAGVLTSGQVTFSPQALNGFNGIGNFVINTGANNTLQGAINFSVVTVPAGSR